MPREFSRKLRVAAELQRLLNELLYTEVKDPRLAGVTVNEVELSADLGVAKVYFGAVDPDFDPQAARAGFDKAAGFLRLRIGQSLRLRRVPELHFVHDLSAQRGFELTQLIDEAARREGSTADGDSAGDFGSDRDDDPDGDFDSDRDGDFDIDRDGDADDDRDEDSGGDPNRD